MVVSVFAAALLLYLSLAGQASGGELAIGIVAAGVTAAFALALRRAAPHRLEGTREHLAPLSRALAALPEATLRTAAVLFRAVLAGASPGRSEVVRFEHGRSDDARERGRRAGAMLYGCLAPDSFVVRMQEGRDEVRLHTLEPLRQAPNPRWLA